MLSSTQTNLLIILLISPLRYFDYYKKNLHTSKKNPTFAQDLFNLFKYKILAIICTGVLAHFMKVNIINLLIVIIFVQYILNILDEIVRDYQSNPNPIIFVIIQIILQIILLFLVNYKPIKYLLLTLIILFSILLIPVLYLSRM